MRVARAASSTGTPHNVMPSDAATAVTAGSRLAAAKARLAKLGQQTAALVEDAHLPPMAMMAELECVRQLIVREQQAATTLVTQVRELSSRRAGLAARQADLRSEVAALKEALGAAMKLVPMTMAAPGASDGLTQWSAAARRRLVVQKKGSKVYAAAFSPDSKLLALGSDDQTHTLTVLSTATWEAVTKITRHKSYVKAVAFSPDGRHLAVGSGDKTASVWNTATWRITASLRGPHSDAVFSVAFGGSRGQYLGIGSADKSASIISTDTWKPIAAPLAGRHTAAVVSTVFCPSGRLFVSTSRDKTAVVTAVETGEMVIRLQGFHAWSIVSAAFSPDAQYLALGSQDTKVTIVDVASWQVVHTLEGLHTDTVSSIAWSPDGRALAVASYDKTLSVVAVGSWDTVAKFDRGDESQGLHSNRKINVVCFSPCGRFMVTGGDDAAINIFDSQGSDEAPPTNPTATN